MGSSSLRTTPDRRPCRRRKHALPGPWRRRRRVLGCGSASLSSRVRPRCRRNSTKYSETATLGASRANRALRPLGRPDTVLASRANDQRSFAIDYDPCGKNLLCKIFSWSDWCYQKRFRGRSRLIAFLRRMRRRVGLSRTRLTY